MKLKIDGTKALSIGATALAVVGTLLSSKVDSNNRKAMKSEIKEELMKELKTKQRGSNDPLLFLVVFEMKGESYETKCIKIM